MAKKTILTNFKLSNEALKKLKDGVGKRYSVKTTDEIKDSELSNVELMLVDTMQKSTGEFLSQKIFDQMPRLKFIQCIFAGVDDMNFEKIPERVKISGNVGAYADAMAEHVMGVILFFAKDYISDNDRLRRGIFKKRYSVQLRAKTIGIVGAGGIGQAVAKLAKSFGMKTMGVNTSGNTVPHFDHVVSMTRLDNVLKQADFVVLSVPLTVKTFHIINRNKLNLMKRNCILVNVARGAVINEGDIYRHLKKNSTFKFANDVWWRYPKRGERFEQHFPFFELPNFLGTPHISGFVPGREHIALMEAIVNLVRFTKRGKVKGLVNRKEYLGLKSLTG